MGKYIPFKLLGPGDSIKEELEFYGWDQKDLADIMGLSEKHVSQLLTNKVPITFDMARQLSQVFKQSPQFWLNLDTNYRLRLEENTQSEETTDRALIFQYMPIRDMKKKEWISPTEDLVEQVKRFWDIKELKFDFLKELIPAYFRKSTAQNHFNPYFALTWLRVAKNKIKNIQSVEKFNEENLYRLSDEIAQMSVEADGIEKIITSLREIGVIFLYLPHLEKTYTDGAVFWHNSNPVIVYTARYDRNDNFWFTLTHEIGHILLHDKSGKSEFIDNIYNIDMEDSAENEADEFARKHLKLNEIIRFFKGVERISRKKVLHVAEILEIHPSIIIGCLQHEKKIKYSTLNDFKEPVRKILDKKTN